MTHRAEHPADCGPFAAYGGGPEPGTGVRPDAVSRTRR